MHLFALQFEFIG